MSTAAGISRPDGQVANEIGNLRDLLFRPKPRVKSLVELNGWLEDQFIAYAWRTGHPEFKDRTIWETAAFTTLSSMLTRGLSLPRNRRFSFWAGFGGSVALSIPLDLIAGRPFGPFRRAISSSCSLRRFSRPATLPNRSTSRASTSERFRNRRDWMAAAHP